jgi:hypothetical protein
MAQDIIDLVKSPGFNLEKLSNNVKTIKKNVDKTLNLVDVKEKVLSNGCKLYYHSLVEVIQKILGNPELTKGAEFCLANFLRLDNECSQHFSH